MKIRRFTIVWASVLAAFAVLAPAAFAGPGTYYASPTGGGTNCENATTPCALTKAVEEGVNEDAVVLEPGTYALKEDLQVNEAIEIGGQPGTTPPVIATNGHAVLIQGADAHVHDLRVEGAGPFQLFSGTGERIFVSFTGSGTEACGMDSGASLINSVCWAHDGGPTANSAAIGMTAAGTATTIMLRNDTAIDSDASGDAIHSRATGKKLVVEATNVIARAENHPDVEVDNGKGSTTEMKLSHSNYATVAGEAVPLATITAPGTNGNQTAAPTFVDAPAGDFREAAGSPTIDAGLTEAANGPLALGGEERSLGTCLGGPVVTDIGAYEFVPTELCGSSMPPPPSSSSTSTTTTTSTPSSTLAISNHVTLGKLKLNKKAGTATLTVQVLDAGTLTLTGKGLKKAVRTSKGAATLHLPIKPSGKTKLALTKTGRAKLALTLTFAPTGGTAAKTSKTIKLLQAKP